MDILGPDEQVADWLGISPVLLDYSKELVADLRPFPHELVPELKSVIARLPGTENTRRQDQARLQLAIGRAFDIVSPSMAELRGFFALYPPTPRTAARIVRGTQVIQEGMSDADIVGYAGGVARRFERDQGREDISGVTLSGSPSSTCFDIANDIAARKGVYKRIPVSRSGNEEQGQAVRLTRAFGSLGLAAEKSSATHVVKALSFIGALKDPRIKRLAVQILTEMLDIGHR